MFISCKKGMEEGSGNGGEIRSTGIDFKLLISLSGKHMKSVKDLIPGTFMSEKTDSTGRPGERKPHKTLMYACGTNMGDIKIYHEFYSDTLRSSYGYFDSITSVEKAMQYYTLFSNELNESATSSFATYGCQFTGMVNTGKYPNWVNKMFDNLENNSRAKYLDYLGELMKTYVITGQDKDYLECEEWWSEYFNPDVVFAKYNPSRSVFSTMDAEEKGYISIGFFISSPID